MSRRREPSISLRRQLPPKCNNAVFAMYVVSQVTDSNLCSTNVWIKIRGPNNLDTVPRIPDVILDDNVQGLKVLISGILTTRCLCVWIRRDCSWYGKDTSVVCLVDLARQLDSPSTPLVSGAKLPLRTTPAFLTVPAGSTIASSPSSASFVA